jgi:hypothetical protein
MKAESLKGSGEGEKEECRRDKTPMKMGSGACICRQSMQEDMIIPLYTIR